MIENRDAEYDAFGPWIIKFDDEDLLPKRFSGHVDMAVNYDLLFKVPRDIERRVAKPGMDLYDMIIGIKDNTLYIYEREDTSVRERVLNVKDVFSLMMHMDLLSGKLVLQMVDGDFTINFNALSKDIVQELVNLIRGAYLPGREIMELTEMSPKTVHSDHYHQNTWLDVKRDEEKVALIGFQGVHELQYKGMKPAARLYNKVMRSHLKSAMYMSNGKELIIAKNGYDFKRFRKADYSTSFTYIPFTRMIQISTLPHGVVPEIQTTSLKVAGKVYKFLFHEDNAEGSKWVKELKSKL